MNDTFKGVAAVVGASFLYGIMPVFTKRVLLDGMTRNTLVFNRFLFTAVFSFLITRLLKVDLRVSRKQFVLLLLAALIGYGLTATFLTLSYTLIPVGLATMFHFTNPLFVTLIMITAFREKATLFKGLSCLLAAAGLVFMADLSVLNGTGIILATLSGLTYAFYVIINKKSSLAELDNFTIIFYVGLINSAFFAVRNVLTGDRLLPSTAKAYITIAFIALACTIFALWLLTYGIRTLGASTASVLNMLEPIVSLVAGILVYHDPLSLKSLIGCVLVVAGGVVIVLDRVKE